MATIVLIRPGSTDYDDQSRLTGSLELPMNDVGLEQVKEIVRQLQHKGIRPQAVFTSPVDPAFSAARSIAEALEVTKLKELDELRNVDQGLWQGLPEADVRKRYPQFFRNGREKPQTICPPEGESLGSACERLAKAVNKAIRKFDVFAIVAPDPMASVIRCALQDRGLAVSSCLSGEQGRPAVELFETDSFDAGSFVRWEDPGIAAAMAADQRAHVETK